MRTVTSAVPVAGTISACSSAGAPTGKAQIDDVPAGSYRLRTWHTRLPVGAPALEQALIVPATGTAEVTVRMQGLQP